MADSKENDVAVAGKTKRILSLDLLRGFFLLLPDAASLTAILKAVRVA